MFHDIKIMFKGGLITENIFNLDPFKKKVHNDSPEQKIWISCQ
jgi:hypothetical protein